MSGRLWAGLLLGVLLAAEQLPTGKIIDEVSAADDAAQKYSLYLPKAYQPDRAWPLILAFDPGGRGRRAVEQYQAAAEKFGYIIAASNVSRNGSWAVSMGAAKAMGVDVMTRFSIDEKRVYTAGMSGGARVAMGVALSSPAFIAGVVASSAGYPDSKPRKTVPFVVFGTAGTEDFNWLEMRQLDHALTSAHRVAIFEAGHVWLSSELALEAVEWLDLQAMKSGRLARDEARLDAMFAAREAKIEALANEAHRCQALDDLAADFNGLRDVTRLTARAAELHRSKSVKDALKKDLSEEKQEQALIDDVLTLEQALNASEQRPAALLRLEDHWKRMTAAANSTSDSPNRRVARRVIRGLSMGAPGRTKDVEYLKRIAPHRPARGAR